METKVQPELELKRKVCESCGESIFEFVTDAPELPKYICTSCAA